MINGKVRVHRIRQENRYDYMGLYGIRQGLIVGDIIASGSKGQMC